MAVPRNPKEPTGAKIWASIWLCLGVYSVIAAAGGGGWPSALMAMVSGFMLARNVADIVQPPNAKLTGDPPQAERPVQRHVGRQGGYVNLDGLFPTLIGLGVVIGLALAVAVPWLWRLLKPWLHAVSS